MCLRQRFHLSGRLQRAWSAFAVVILGSAVAAASENRAVVTTPEERIDKSQFHLFNPTPRPWLRELSADRPDKTDSAFTVDAGHLQLEVDVANCTIDHHNPDRDQRHVEAFNLASMNLKVGVLNNTVSVSAFWFAQIKSTLPSPLTSAAVTESGKSPTPGEEAITKPPLPLFVNTVSVLSKAFALIKSTLPSPLTSAVVTA